VTAASHEDSLVESQQQWRTVRGFLNQHRHELTGIAAKLHNDHHREGLLLTRPDWLPATPVPLDTIKLTWIAQASEAAINGSEPESYLTRPLRAPGQRYACYADALAALGRPRLFEDRPSYRLLAVDWSDHGSLGGQLAFWRGSYFQILNICEAAAHELAAVVLDIPEPERAHIQWLRGRLPFRALITDPFDLRLRPILPAISTLTIRRDTAAGTATWLAHWRDPAKVASGGGLYQVMPVGVFQPATSSAAAEANDLDLWRCMAREFNEELLGAPEPASHDAALIDYATWPFFQALEQARHQGRLRVYCLGLGVDPLTLVTDILMACVFDDQVFDTIFDGIVTTNAEGDIVGDDGGVPAVAGVPFTQQSVERFAAAKPMQPAGAALLRLAWQHRATLLSP
jgi:hypothetical protein